ncbi:MAG: methionyl-tRNA formyltransferase [Proteobacteria bacterium]|nr:methionyl-tRNA formyltransferase [Pseudomonadota bacterium]
MNRPLRIIYAGTPDFSVPALDALLASEHEVVAVYTQPDRPAGRGRGFRASPVKEKALAFDVPVYQPESLKDEQALTELQALDADLMVVTAYGLLLPPAVLQAPRLGCINIHASLLPRWRGAAPIQRAILAGDTRTGITIMQMDEGLDTGDMLAVAECEIGPEDTGSTLHDRLMLLGAETLMSALPAIAEQTLHGIVQQDDVACYASKLSKAEAKIDWSDSAVQIERAIRAYNAWPVAYCRYEKNSKTANLRLWQADVLAEDAPEKSIPGKVVAESADGIDVVCGEGLLRITRLQPEGKRQMAVADFLNANSLLDQILG